MNQLPAYEQMIAEELEGIEIPGLADAIWGRIETALDVEMPVNDTPAPPKGKPVFKNPGVWLVSAGIIAIIIVLFLLSKSRKTAPPPQRNLPRHTGPAVIPDTIMRHNVIRSQPLKTAPGKNTSVMDEKQVADTAAHSAFITGRKDSSLLKTPPAVNMPPDMMHPSIEIKQPRKYGVDVSDSDYRFKVKPKE